MMTMLMLVGLFGGLGMFIYGMHLMSEGLKIVAGSKMKQLLEMLTNTPLKALLCGVIVTIMVQSSSTTTVMVVGFVNASLMTLNQAAGIILGSNIGTTFMAQIIAFDITAYSPFFIGLGTFMALFGRNKKMRDWGSIILGFGILFTGINTMSASVEPLNESPEFIDFLLTYGKNPVVGLLASAAMTAILQSSGAVIGLVQALAISGVFSTTSGTEAIQICMPLIIGSNIGTCVTAILSSIGTSNVAKDAALIHLFVNIFGAIWVMPLLYCLDNFLPVNPIYEFIISISGNTVLGGHVVPNVARQIAMGHSLFNIANTIVLFPFLNAIVRLVERILPPEPAEEGLHLDKRLLNTPEVALSQAENELVKMSRVCAKNFGRAMDALIDLSEKKIKKVMEVEDVVDNFEIGIQEYLIRVSNLTLSQRQNERVVYIIESCHVLERIGDHAENLADLAHDMLIEKKKFTPGMVSAMVEIKQRIGVMLDQVTRILEEPENDEIKQIFREEEFIDRIAERLRSTRINHLTGTDERVYSTFVFVDMLTNIERISDLAENIANMTKQAEEAESVNVIEEVIY